MPLKGGPCEAEIPKGKPMLGEPEVTAPLRLDPFRNRVPMDEGFDVERPCVVFCATIRANGSLGEIFPLDCFHRSNQSMISEALMEAQVWEFQAGTVDGKPADILVGLRVPVNIRP